MDAQTDARAEIARARQVAAEIAARVYRRPAPLRLGFITRVEPNDPVPPLVHMLRGGRGGHVRLKLYLSILWAAAAPPHDVSPPARVWAELLGLPDPETNGIRRIRAAVDWLEAHSLIATNERPGMPGTIRVLNESGTGEPYVHPGAIARQLQAVDMPIPLTERYLRIPSEFWTTGLIAELSGPGVAMFLILLRLSRTGERDEVWLSPSQAEDRFSLSTDTRIAGLRELTKRGVVTMRRKVVDETIFDFRRLRNVYTLNPWILNTPSEATPTETPPTKFTISDLLDE